MFILQGLNFQVSTLCQMTLFSFFRIFSHFEHICDMEIPERYLHLLESWDILFKRVHYLRHER